MDLLRLRRETEADHLAVEGTVPLMDAGLDMAQYARCLQRMYGVVAAWEECAATLAPEWMRPMLAARRREGLLAEDLAALGVTRPDARRPRLPAMSDLPSLLGTMYVMEGSTLGGQLIARHVAAVLHLEEGRGNAYFRGHGETTGRMWKEFCEVLKARVAEEEAAVAVAAAKAMFEVFGGWMREGSDTNAG